MKLILDLCYLPIHVDIGWLQTDWKSLEGAARSKSLQIAATNHKLQKSNKSQIAKKATNHKLQKSNKSQIAKKSVYKENGFRLKDAFNTLQISANKSQIAKT